MTRAPEMRPWITTDLAADLTGRSRRTLRRWRRESLVTTKLDDDGRTRLWSTADLLRVEADKTEYTTRPTFQSRISSPM